MSLRLALLFQAGNFVGREYYWRLLEAGLGLALTVAVGRMSEESIAREQERTAGKWNPRPLPECLRVHEFDSLRDGALWDLIRSHEIDIAIQGGVGFLKPQMLAAPRSGFLNVHPGRLPAYRGNSCPEWALHNGEGIYASAHFVDSGIDTGPVIYEELYELRDGWDYYDMRANLYSHCAKVLIRALRMIESAGADIGPLLIHQDSKAGTYWPPMSEQQLSSLISSMAQRTDDR